MIQEHTDENSLTEILKNAVEFSQNIIWPYTDNHLSLATSKEELVEIFKLRSAVYDKMGYKKEFPDLLEGFNFDMYDSHAAIFYVQQHGKITGTCRIIFDQDRHLPIDTNYSLDDFRQKEKRIAELSRFIIDSNVAGLSPEFKLLIKGMYGIIIYNSIDMAVSVIAQKHFKFYEKVGGFKHEALLKTYGKLPNPYIITSWDTAHISSFFKKAFLREKVA